MDRRMFGGELRGQLRCGTSPVEDEGDGIVHSRGTSEGERMIASYERRSDSIPPLCFRAYSNGI